MMSSGYTAIETNVPSNGGYQGSNFTQYSASNSSYPTMSQYHAGNGAQAVLSAPPTPQFIQTTSLGPPSPAALGSPYSTHATPYPPHAMPSPQLSSATHHTARTVYIGNIPSDTSISELLDHVKTGSLDSVRPFPEKNCAFIAFVEAAAAAQFYHEATTKKLAINGQELRIGWGRPSSIPTPIQMALSNGASRNVFLGSLDETITEQFIQENLSRFGQIEHIKLLREKNIAFVHFLSISNAIKCVATLPTESKWSSRRVNYGRDRCAPSSKVSSANMYLATTAAQQVYPSSFHHQLRYPSVSYDPYTGATIETYQGHSGAANVSGTHNPGGTIDPITSLAGIANRTIYLGNIHPDTTCEEICNVIRGGILSQIRYLPDKHIAFVTFVDPALALHFYNQSLYHGLVIKNRRLKIGWGKASALSPAVIAAVQNGGSRNVYLGNIDDTITEEKLKQDFSDYGEIELVNTLKEKNCAFVNFTSIAASVRAIEGIRSKEEYKKFRINYGKDRCGNPPRIVRAAMQQQQSPLQPQQPSQQALSTHQAALAVAEAQVETQVQEGQPPAMNGMLESVLASNG